MEDLNNVGVNGNLLTAASGNRPPVDDNGRPLRVQRTQLLNLQPAGGKKNQSSTNVDQVSQSNGGLKHVESLEEEDLEKMSSQQQETLSQAQT